MKSPFLGTFIAVFAFALPHTANAALLAGWYDFDSTTTNEAADVAALGYSGLVTKGGQGSVTNGGSNDGRYGNSTIPTGAVASDGYARISASSLTFSLKNVSGGTTSLTSLLFDAANQGGGGAVTVKYQIGAGPLVTLGTKSPVPDSGAAGAFVNYGDFAFSLVGVPLLSVGQTINFIFTAAPNARIDNIAIAGISAIPEPGSLLAIGCVLGSGLLLRNRRPRQALA